MRKYNFILYFSLLSQVTEWSCSVWKHSSKIVLRKPQYVKLAPKAHTECRQSGDF